MSRIWTPDHKEFFIFKLGVSYGVNSEMIVPRKDDLLQNLVRVKAKRKELNVKDFFDIGLRDRIGYFSPQVEEVITYGLKTQLIRKIIGQTSLSNCYRVVVHRESLIESVKESELSSTDSQLLEDIVKAMEELNLSLRPSG